MKKNILLKVKAGFTLLVLVLAFFVTNIEPARAIPTEVILSIPEAQRTILQKIQVYADKAWKTFGAKLVGTTVRNTLNRVALDAAKRVATSGEGQKPTYIIEDLGSYWKNVGDAAAGDFIDGLGESWGVDLCQPPSAELQAKISLGLVQTLAPEAPNCTLTNLVNNYSSAYEKYKAMETGDYLKGIQISMEPGAGELGGAFTLFGRTNEVSTKASEDEKTKNTITEGWLDVRNIAGKLEGTPGAAKDDLNTAKNTQAQSLLSTTGDALVDASNTFLNQLAYEGFQRVLRELSKNGSTASQPLDTTKLKTSGYESLIQYGESVVSEKLASVIKPRFDVRSDYSILSDLASCADRNNPSPTSCVIDDKFSQAISEKITVGEALNKGYLHGDWLVSDNSKSDNTYTLRSVNILRKYRILPVGWEQAISVATSKGYKVTLQDLVSCFDGNGLFSNDFDKNNQSWCRGLVDPNWVLKAPLNFCAKQGNGSQILSSLISQDANSLATLIVSRATDYCADDQTCIKEKTDGSCEVYGYCNEEKRTWKFGSDSCEPTYNTCQTFTSVSDKQTASFLENTLDYSTCDSNNSGCKQYSYSGSYTSSNNSISWNKNASIFFNNKAVTCDASNEACTQLLRGKPGWIDVNYVMDTAFSLNNIGDTSASSSNWHWPIVNGTGTIINDNGKALFIDGHSGAALRSDNNNNVLPKNLAPISGWSYTLSAEIKVNSGNSVTMTLGDNGDKAETTSDSWNLVSVTTTNTNTLDFSISGTGSKNISSFSIRNLKLSPNNYYAGYSSYAAFPVNEKLLPNYLEQSCYNSVSGTGDYTLKDNAPAVCSNFARKCNRSEVGCELFTSVKDLFAVAAKANVNDYCDASCVGYDTYLAKASYFYGTSADNLIPDKTNSCSAESAGCASFTNLDAATSGGESVEYYAKVRQCIKPDTASCSDFYSWDNAQLKVMSLKKDSGGNPFIVDATSDCNQTIYNLPITDPNYNSDCREFYSKSGQVTYHVISNTVSCSDDCRSYRLNEKNIDKNLNASSCVDATGIDRTWDTNQNSCYVCKNGGVWDATQSACIYKAIPSEGTTCSAEEVGCREYNGNNGNSLKLKAAYDFEAGINGFYALDGGFIASGLESTSKDGHSLNINGNVAVDISNFATTGSSYVAKFMAKSLGGGAINMSFENSDKEVSIFNVDGNNLQGNIAVKGDNQWHVYEVNLGKLDHKTVSEILKITASTNLYIDNLVVNEISDRYYLIQGSSNVPSVCFYDMNDVFQGPSYNLGCAAYTDRAGTTHNLHQFSELCQNSAVGCEQMIQTNNSSNYYGYNVNLNNADKTVSCVAGTPGCIEVKNTEAIYAVFDSNKQCNKADIGCSRFGYLKTTGGTSTWVDVFKKNLPDAYNNETTSPLCKSNEVGCDTWVYSNGSASYFKTPGLNTCVFKNNVWYKSPVKRCDINGDGKIGGTEKTSAICLTDSDCGTNKCVTDSNDYPCNISYLKTVGLGGINGRVATPDGAVGLCNTESAGCSEYIDPVSKHVNNLIYNPTAEEIDGISADKWVPFSTGVYSQRISITPNKLYILQVDGNNNGKAVVAGNFSTSFVSASDNTVRILKEDNTFGDLVTTVSTNGSIIFNSGINNYVTIFRNSITINSNTPAATISVKEAIVNYQVNTNLDMSSCNGVVNTDAGCILFNARTQIGNSGLNKNIFNATLTNDGVAPASCSATDTSCLNNANSVIKVSPDRVCSRWLSCQTYTEDPITHERSCYKMGECDQLNEKNECGNFLAVDNTNRDIKNSQNKNATGYALLDNWYIGGMKEVGQNTEAHFDFENSSVNLTCSRKIDVASNPVLGGVIKDSACIFDKNINDSLVLTPSGTPTDYPAHGKGFLKVLNYYQISPQSNNSSISVYTNQDYYINYLVNTKGSNAKAKLLITDTSGNVKVKFVDESSSGWQRKVYKFKLTDPSGQSKLTSIKIYLTSDATNVTTGYVYFDDINIEPVLQTGNNSYVTKDCRLYPSDDSLSCLSSNNNVIKDGLFGYCLQYDKLNPGVCLMWYPVDNISPITRSNQSVLGYSGKFPLYYCTEANGGFNLVEKIMASSASTCRGEEDTCSHGIKDGKYECSLTVGCDSVPDRPGNDGDSNYVTLEMWGNVLGHDGYDHKICIPNPAKLKVKTKTVTIDALRGIGDETSASCGYKNGVFVKGGTEIVYDEGWFNYNGSFKKVTDFIDEEANTIGTEFDSIMVLNTGGTLESDLKYISNADADKAFRISCNKLSKFVENDGSSISWTGRIGRSSIFSTSTPDFFSNGSFAGLQLFGRSREDVPFGAAALTSDYNINNSEPLVLRNQYSKQQSETLFAGRPYGCSNGTNGGAGCNNIGQCSLDPNVFCVYSGSNNDVNSKGCSAGGNGTCIPLWSIVPSETNAISVLNQIFVEKYGDFVYSKGKGYELRGTSEPFIRASDINDEYKSHTLSVPEKFGKVLPIITNKDFRLVGSTNKATISGGKVNITEAGLYQLSFNTDIDVEQQPMKQIIINWGDSLQVVTNTDNKPEENSPHKFYHFYLKNASANVKIIVSDNWNKSFCSLMSGSDWSNCN